MSPQHPHLATLHEVIVQHYLDGRRVQDQLLRVRRVDESRKREIRVSNVAIPVPLLLYLHIHIATPYIYYAYAFVYPLQSMNVFK